MGAVVKVFLRVKHWQIFLLLFGVGYVGGIAAMLLPLVTSRSPEELLKFSLPFGFVMALFIGLLRVRTVQYDSQMLCFLAITLGVTIDEFFCTCRCPRICA
jgi:hypothetical protein